MEDKALLINNLLDEIHDNISILKEYGFKYDEFSIVYNNMEESFQKIVSSDTYNTNVQVLFEDERLNDLYDMCKSYNTQLKTKVSYFRIFQTTEKILKNYDNNCFEQYLREVLNDFHLYTFAIKEGYIEDEKSDKIYELIYKLIKKEYSTNYHSLLIDLLYKNTLLYKLKDYVEKDIEYHKKDGDIRRMLRECDYGFMDAIPIIALIESNQKYLLIKTLRKYKKEYKSYLREYNYKKKEYTSRVNKLEYNKSSCKKKKKELKKIYGSLLLSISIIIGINKLNNSMSNWNNTIIEKHKNNEMTDTDFNKCEIGYNIIVCLTIIAEIACVIDAFSSGQKIIEEFFNLLIHPDKTILKEILNLTEQIKKDLKELDISEEKYFEYYKKLTSFEEDCNYLYDKYKDFDYLMTKNGIERIKHVEYGI